MKINFSDLSRTISHALRHEPWIYELEIDNDGWVPVNTLLESLRTIKHDWNDLTTEHLEKMIAKAGKTRHELKDDKIRALYGHTIPGKLGKTAAEPPEILFHGTAPETIKLIFLEGLKPMDRQYVHLGVEKKTVEKVGLRKSNTPVILKINAKRAYQEGIAFYEGNDKIWLSDKIPPEYISA